MKKITTQKDALEQLLVSYKKMHAHAKSKLEKCNDMSARKSAAKWSPEKKKKTSNRVLEASKELINTEAIIEQIESQLRQLA